MEVLRTLVLSWLLIAAFGVRLYGQSSFHEGFEDAAPSLKAAGADVAYQLVAQVRSKQSPHSGSSCEVLKLVGDNGQTIYFGLGIPPGLIITELAPSVWIRSDRPGLQLFARVVLPRSRNPKTGQPLTALIPGTGYTQAGNWQQLRIDGIEKLFERQLRGLRAQYGKNVDGVGAYIDQLVLNVYGGPGSTTVWIDDVDVAGLVDPQSIAAGPKSAGNADESRDRAERLPATWTGGPTANRASPRVSLNGVTLEVDGSPLFPRIVEYRGEKLAFLLSLGFNTAFIAGPATPELLSEATEAAMWLIAQPPSLEELVRQPNESIGSQFAPVIAWHLGMGLTGRELMSVKAWAQQLKASDERMRPLLAAPQSDLRAFGHSLDILLAEREALGSTLDMWEYFAWLKQRSQLARLGTPLWATVQSQPSAQCREQANGLTVGQLSNAEATHSQIRALAFLSLGASARGLLFHSESPLDARDAATQTRAASLALVNIELQLLEPWSVGAVNSTLIESNDGELSAVVLSSAKGRVLIPLPKSAGQQAAFGGWPSGPVSFTVPGASAASLAYDLTPAGMRPLDVKRVTGGMRVVLDGNHETLVLLTQDRRVVTSLAKRIEKVAQRGVELKRSIGARQLAITEAMHSPVSAARPDTEKSSDPLALARQLMAQADSASGKADLAGGWRRVTKAIEITSNAQHAHWVQHVGSDLSLVSNPLQAHVSTLPALQRLPVLSAATQNSGALIPGGDFESLEVMLHHGWRHFQQRQPGVAAQVELSTDQPHAGRYSLTLSALPESKASVESIIETPPLWITSGPINVQSGQRLLIRGWVQTGSTITGSVDGLLIMDSLGGEPLAVRVRECAKWQPFTLVRAATSSGPMTVTFALTGLGTVFLDDLTLDVLDAKPPAQQAALPRQWPRAAISR